MFSSQLVEAVNARGYGHLLEETSSVEEALAALEADRINHDTPKEMREFRAVRSVLRRRIETPARVEHPGCEATWGAWVD